MEYFREYFQFLIKFKSNCAEHERQFNELKMMLLSAYDDDELAFMSHLVEKQIKGKTLLMFEVLTTYRTIRKANEILLHSSLAYEISYFHATNKDKIYETIPIYEEYGRW